MNPLLQDSLRRLALHYAGGQVEEVAVNRPGEVWVKRVGADWSLRRDANVTGEYITSLCQHLANVSGQPFHRRRMPLLYATLPEGHRFTALVGPNVRHDMGDTQGIAVTIRIFDPARRISLDRYGLQPGQTALPPPPVAARRDRYEAEPLADLLAAVKNREAILISGATATGKTTFLNALIGYLPQATRVVTVEDAREVIVPQENRVHLVVSRTETANGIDVVKVVDAVVRLTPDVIVCGEIGIANAVGVFRLMTTGHTNFMATIHARSPEAALKAFYQNLAQSSAGLDAATAIDIIAGAFGRIVQIDRFGTRRVVTAIDIPAMARLALTAED